jgi:hypothetical protein
MVIGKLGQIIGMNHLYGRADMKYYSEPLPILGLEDYREDEPEHEFSRRQIWFYAYGDEEIEKDFRSRLGSLIESRFVEDTIDWDLMTLYPTHVEGEVNSNMQALLRSIASETGIRYEQIINRNKTIEENHQLESEKAKVVNLEGTTDLKDFEDKNIILVDNITLSGASMLHGANKLLQNGAENVFGVCLGLGDSVPNKKQVPQGKKARHLL